jgi:hypothetical protein
MESASTDRSGLPTWAKFVIATVVITVSFGFVFVLSSVIFIANFSNPVVVKKVANSILQLDTPLPPGFKYAGAFDLLDFKMAALLHFPDNLELILLSMPSTKSSATLEDHMSSAFLKPAISSATGSNTAFAASLKGGERIANKQFTYAIGTLHDKTGRMIPALIGFFSPSQNAHATILIGVQGRHSRKISDPRVPDQVAAVSQSHRVFDAGDSGQPDVPDSSDPVKAYNMRATENFLHAIKNIP